jgi:hypothetical protein
LGNNLIFLGEIFCGNMETFFGIGKKCGFLAKHLKKAKKLYIEKGEA